MRCTGPAMMDFQNDKSNIASRPFMELLEFRSMIFLEAKKDSWKTFFPPQRSQKRSACWPRTARFAQVAGIRVGRHLAVEESCLCR